MTEDSSRHPLDTSDWVAALDWESARLTCEANDQGPSIVSSGRTTLLYYGRTRSQAQRARTFLSGWRQRGAAVFEDLVDEAILLIWDGDHAQLLAARDRLGAIPLYCSASSRQTLLSPALDRLTARRGADHSPDALTIGRHLSHDWRDPDRTFHAGITRVPAGHLLKVNAARQVTERYWDPLPYGQAVDWLDDDAPERFAAAFEAAVDRTVRSGPSGIFLSGGLDSVSVASVATELARRASASAPVALSLAFPHPETDERDVQRGVAEALGMPQVMMEFDHAVGPDGALRAALVTSRRWSQPLLNFWMPAYLSLGAEGRRQGCQSLFTGGGGDEWLVVGPFYAADLLGRGDLKGLARLVSISRQSYRLSLSQSLGNVMWQYGLKPRVAKAVRRSLTRTAPDLCRSLLAKKNDRALPTWLAPDARLRHQLAEPAPWRHGEDLPDSYYLASIRSELDHPLASWEMEEIYEQGRRTGVSIAQPFWDAELVQLLMGVRPERLNQGRRTKGLVREALADRMPRLGFQQQRKVTSLHFFGQTLIAGCHDAWRQLGGAPMLADLGILEPRGFERFMDDQARRGPDHHVSRIWDVLNVESWLQGHFS